MRIREAGQCPSFCNLVLSSSSRDALRNSAIFVGDNGATVKIQNLHMNKSHWQIKGMIQKNALNQSQINLFCIYCEQNQLINYTAKTLLFVIEAESI